MAKYYVESGEFQTIVQADDAYKAALWAAHLAMEEILPIDDIDWLEEGPVGKMQYEDGLTPLGSVFDISEQGFGKNEAGSFFFASCRDRNGINC